jgi:hypothetical protein
MTGLHDDGDGSEASEWRERGGVVEMGEEGVW